MDYRNFIKIYFCLLVFGILIITGCNSNKSDDNLGETYYVELLNFNDSLKQNISSNIFGKVTYFKNEKLQLISVNFITEKYPDMHNFKSIDLTGKNIITGTKKIQLEFKGEYSIHSIKFSMQKFSYENNNWKKISDMGVLSVNTTYKRAKMNAIEEFSKQIANNIAHYSY